MMTTPYIRASVRGGRKKPELLVFPLRAVGKKVSKVLFVMYVRSMEYEGEGYGRAGTG